MQLIKNVDHGKSEWSECHLYFGIEYLSYFVLIKSQGIGHPISVYNCSDWTVTPLATNIIIDMHGLAKEHGITNDYVLILEDNEKSNFCFCFPSEVCLCSRVSLVGHNNHFK